MCILLGYGHTRLYGMRLGYDLMMEAETGLMYITGEENGTSVLLLRAKPTSFSACSDRCGILIESMRDSPNDVL